MVNSTPDIKRVLVAVENDTLESSVKELDSIKILVGTVDIKEVARIFLKFIKEFRKQIGFVDLNANEQSYFEAYEETIESNIDDRATLESLLSDYIDKLVDIIRSKKKLV